MFARQRASDGTIADDRAMGWRPLYPYLGQRRFTKWKPEEVDERVDEEWCPLAIKLFISHRWKTSHDPDPHCETLPAIVEYLSRVYIVANGFLDESAYVVKELVPSGGW